MRTSRTVNELRRALADSRLARQRIGLVPTMGALHEGHLSLIRRARAECDVVVVSVFVNPTQFGPEEDLDAYPRNEERDARLAAEAGADELFAPSVAEVYPPGFATTVSVSGVTKTLCGAQRSPEHFVAVATVVTKLLNMVGPDAAYFGQKDAQQAVVIRRLVADLSIPTEVVVCPIVRDADGLALSSRNAYLDDIQRARALALRRGLDAAELAVRQGERDAGRVAAAGRRVMLDLGVEPEYLEVVDPQDLRPVQTIDGQVLVAVAAQVGPARLIDNSLIPAGQAAQRESPGEHRERIGAFNDQIGATEPCSV
ncbi:MAG TPA: pantoate--beta-alanine ligase [Solirubrobacteraceae bacterium]|nr:pantoate--beta-alanine ligase [Solirubrobacteraceae bacterium]